MKELKKTTQKIKLSAVKVGERFRKDIGDIIELKKSLKAAGQIQPIVLDKDYQLIAGHRRFLAAVSLGWDEIDATIILDEIDTTTARLIELEENVQRKEFTPEEQVRAVSKVHELLRAEKPGWKQGDTARKLGKTDAWLSQQVQLASEIDSDPKLLDVLRKQGIGPAYELLKLRRAQEKTQLLARHPYNAVQTSGLEKRIIPEIHVLACTTIWLHKHNFQIERVSIPNNPDLSQDEQVEIIRSRLSAHNVPFNRLIHGATGPDIIAGSESVLWKIECKGLGAGQFASLKSKFQDAVASAVSYFDQEGGLRVGLAMPITADYLDLVRGWLPKAARKALSLWIFLVDTESTEVRVIQPDDNA